MRVNTRVIVLLAILASLISFAKFSHCEKSVWAGPDQYIHACYSDLPALFSERSFGKGEWAFSGGVQAVEGEMNWVNLYYSLKWDQDRAREQVSLIGIMCAAASACFWASSSTAMRARADSMAASTSAESPPAAFAMASCSLIFAMSSSWAAMTLSMSDSSPLVAVRRMSRSSPSAS